MSRLPTDNIPARRLGFFSVVKRLVVIQLKAVPVYSVFSFLMLFAHGMLFALTAIVAQALFDAIGLVATGEIDFMSALAPLLILAGVTFGQQIINGTHEFLINALNDKCAGKINTLLQAKLQRVNPIQFEDVSFLNNVNKAREGIRIVPYYTMILFIFINYYGIYFAIVGFYLFNLKPSLLVILIIAFIPAILELIVKAKIFTKLEDESAPLRRENEYYQKALCEREYFKETRILGAFNYFHKQFSDTMLSLIRKTWKTEKKASWLQLSLSLTKFGGMAIATYMLFVATMNGEISIGAFVAVLTALGQFFGMMQEIFT